MVIFWVLTVCGGVTRQYGNFYQNYNNFSKIVFSVYIGDSRYSIVIHCRAVILRFIVRKNSRGGFCFCMNAQEKYLRNNSYLY